MKNENTKNEEDRFGEVLRTIESTEAPEAAFLEELREQSAGVFKQATTTPTPSIATEKVNPSTQSPLSKPSAARRLFRWGAPLTTAAAILLAVVFWPGDQGASLAWAEVVAEVGKTDSVHIKTESHDRGKTTRGEFFIRDVGLLRLNEYVNGDGQPPNGQIFNLVTGEQIEFDGLARAYARTKIEQGLEQKMNSILMMLKMIGWPGQSDQVGFADPNADMQKEGWRVDVEALEAAEHEGRLKKRFSFQVYVSQADGQEKAMFQTQTIWIDPDSNRVERIVFSYPPSKDDVVATFDFDPDFTDDVFDPPAGYTDIEALEEEEMAAEERKIGVE